MPPKNRRSGDTHASEKRRKCICAALMAMVPIVATVTIVVLLVELKTSQPAGIPTAAPTAVPTAAPTNVPTAPTAAPSTGPTGSPTLVPSATPTHLPTSNPSATPSTTPTQAPSAVPSAAPTGSGADTLGGAAGISNSTAGAVAAVSVVVAIAAVSVVLVVRRARKRDNDEGALSAGPLTAGVAPGGASPMYDQDTQPLLGGGGTGRQAGGGVPLQAALAGYARTEGMRPVLSRAPSDGSQTARSEPAHLPGRAHPSTAARKPRKRPAFVLVSLDQIGELRGAAEDEAEETRYGTDDTDPVYLAGLEGDAIIDQECGVDYWPGVTGVAAAGVSIRSTPMGTEPDGSVHLPVRSGNVSPVSQLTTGSRAPSKHPSRPPSQHPSQVSRPRPKPLRTGSPLSVSSATQSDRVQPPPPPDSPPPPIPPLPSMPAFMAAQAAGEISVIDTPPT